MSTPLLEIKNVKKYYPVKKVHAGLSLVNKAVDGVDLEVEEGEICGLVGESGCGKSTLGKAVVRLHDVTEGEILFRGVNIAALNEKEMKSYRQKIQIVFQDPYGSLNPKKKVGAIVQAPLDALSSLSSAEKKQKVVEMLEEVGLNDKYLEKYPHEMSGGQRQRVVIARALINNPDLVICDEPVSALDVSVRAQVLNLLKDLQKERKLTYIFISHDLSVVEYLCDKVAVMYLGKIVEVAKKEDLFANPLHPYTEALLSAIPVPDIHVKKKEIILQGDVPSPINPPTGCYFHPRCPKATERCAIEAPPLVEFRTADGGKRKVACFLCEDTEEVI